MKGVLVDTSVWVDHFRRRNDALIDLLERDLVVTRIPLSSAKFRAEPRRIGFER